MVSNASLDPVAGAGSYRLMFGKECNLKQKRKKKEKVRKERERGVTERK